MPQFPTWHIIKFKESSLLTPSRCERRARDFGLFAIKRTFLLDSAALDSALRSLDQFMPDALEVLPAMTAPHIVNRLHKMYPTLPVIAGGTGHHTSGN